MDGLLIDSEPLWQEAEIEVFAGVGVHLTREMCLETMGRRIDEVVTYWHAKHPWEGPSVDDIKHAVVDRMVELITEKGRLLDGASDVVGFVSTKVAHVAIASSSTAPVIDAVMKVSGLRDRFDLIHSAEHETHGKPHPAVYLSAASQLGVAPERCLALEDSINGVIAAKAARMTCVAVPEPHATNKTSFAVADLVLTSLKELPRRWNELLGP